GPMVGARTTPRSHLAPPVRLGDVFVTPAASTRGVASTIVPSGRTATPTTSYAPGAGLSEPRNEPCRPVERDERRRGDGRPGGEHEPAGRGGRGAGGRRARTGGCGSPCRSCRRPAPPARRRGRSCRRRRLRGRGRSST